MTVSIATTYIVVIGDARFALSEPELLDLRDAINGLLKTRPGNGHTERSWRSWTTEEDDVLREMCARQHPYPDIARALNRTVRATQQRAYKQRQLDRAREATP